MERPEVGNVTEPENQQAQRRAYLIRALLSEHGDCAGVEVPASEAQQRSLLRALMNVRPAMPASTEFLQVQDAYLQAETTARGLVDIADLQPVERIGNPSGGDCASEGGIYLWQGDICTLRCGAIVNAANSAMTGCWHPNHTCIDNCIHTYAGIQLRLECDRIIRDQGHPEPTGRAKITPAYNLPCHYVLHTVGPIVDGRPSPDDERLLASCYRSCLELARANDVESVAFCCISTGVFGYPNDAAAQVAVSTVRNFLREAAGDDDSDAGNGSGGDRNGMKVVFNVFKNVDLHIYQQLLG